MKKRNKQICINLCDDDYNALLFLSNKDRRKLAEYVYLIVIDNIENKIAAAACIYSDIKKLKFNNGDADD